MSILDWFAKKNKKDKQLSNKLNIPGNLWIKCKKCGEPQFQKDLEDNYMVCHCPKSYHFRISPQQRIAYTFDHQSFKESDHNIKSIDFLKFTDTESYEKRIDSAIKKTNMNDAIVIGTAKINGKNVNVGIMNFNFMGGSMGSVVGEKITRLIEQAISNKYPLLIFSASGGARMQEGILSLMQMAKTSAALAKLQEACVPFISILSDPTTGGTSASFAMLGDLNIAEPEALISFAGPRVIEQTIRQKLPEGFQRSEFLLEKGFIDRVIDRRKMKSELYKMITLLNPHEDTK